MPVYGEGFLDYFQYALPTVVAANSGYEIYKHSKEKKPNKTAMIKNAIIGSLAIGDIYGRMNQLQHEVETNVITARQAQAEGRQILAEAGDQLELLHDVETVEAPPPPPPPPPFNFGGPPPPPPPMMTTTMPRQPSPRNTGPPPTLTSAPPAARPAMADLLSGITQGKKLKSRATAMPDEEIAPEVNTRKKPMDMFDAILQIGKENKAKPKSGLSIEEQVKAAQELKKAEQANKSFAFLSAAMAKRNRSLATPIPTTEDENQAEWGEDISQANRDAAQAERQGQLLIQAEQEAAQQVREGLSLIEADEEARRAIEKGIKKAGPKTLPKKGKGIKGLKELIEEHARIVAELKPLTKEYKIQKKELEKYRRKKY